MRVISRSRLRAFWRGHADAEQALEAWYRAAKRAAWQNLAELTKELPHADVVGDCTVFNIKGNDHRLVAKVYYRAQRIYVRVVLTHAEYNKGAWKSDCNSY